MSVARVTSDAEARALAARLNGADRTRPTAVVTTPTHCRSPYIDAEAIARDLGDLAEVYLIETGPHTWAFSDVMAPQTQVYGGAGRVYPLGREWLADPHRSPLRFAYDAAEGERATQRLIDDGLDMAAAAGLIGRPEHGGQRTRVSGIVRGIISQRAVVETTTGMVTVPPQLAAPGIPIERVLTKGMVVSGWVGPRSAWCDIRDGARSAADALASYAVGDVVLARVAHIEAGSAELWLHPDQRVRVDRRDVTGELMGDLRSLLTDGEVLAARIVAAGPNWRVTLYDADEESRPAVALYDGGPPWLEPPLEDEPDHEPVSSPAPLPAAAPATAPAATPPSPVVEQPADARPSPLMLDPKRRDQAPCPPPETTTPAAQPAVVARPEVVEGLKDKIRELESKLAGYRQDHDQLRALRRHHEGKLAQLDKQLSKMRMQLRKAQSRPAGVDLPEFADRARGFRHAVEHAWARRTPVGEQPSRPLGDYVIGPDFLDSLAAVDGVSVAKVADVVFEVVTGHAESLDGRDLHRLRTGSGGDDPARTREDGASCWRVAIQRNTPSARRLHYWRLPDGRIELSRVVLHDDMEP